ncbi:MAG: hypothetical protein AWU57_4630, partial [Marinobacter sp. T13-3]
MAISTTIQAGIQPRPNVAGTGKPSQSIGANTPVGRIQA